MPMLRCLLALVLLLVVSANVKADQEQTEEELDTEIAKAIRVVLICNDDLVAAQERLSILRRDKAQRLRALVSKLEARLKASSTNSKEDRTRRDELAKQIAILTGRFEYQVIAVPQAAPNVAEAQKNKDQPKDVIGTIDEPSRPTENKAAEDTDSLQKSIVKLERQLKDVSTDTEEDRAKSKLLADRLAELKKQKKAVDRKNPNWRMRLAAIEEGIRERDEKKKAELAAKEGRDYPTDLIVGKWKVRNSIAPPSQIDETMELFKDGSGKAYGTRNGVFGEMVLSWKVTETIGNACIVVIDFPKAEKPHPMKCLIAFDGKNSLVMQSHQNVIERMNRQKE